MLVMHVFFIIIHTDFPSWSDAFGQRSVFIWAWNTHTHTQEREVFRNYKLKGWGESVYLSLAFYSGKISGKLIPTVIKF